MNPISIKSVFTLFSELSTHYSPIGPFLVLSAISIWRDGLAAWGIPPCRDYVAFCAALPSFELLGRSSQF